MELTKPGGKRGVDAHKLVSVHGILVLVALWLIVSPYLLGYGGNPAALWDSIIIGIVVATIALVRAYSPQASPWLSWTGFALGLWLLIAPFLLSFKGLNLAHWNTTLTGIVVASLAAWSALTPTAEAS
jgi:hypothetical protein